MSWSLKWETSSLLEPFALRDSHKKKTCLTKSTKLFAGRKTNCSLLSGMKCSSVCLHCALVFTAQLLTGSEHQSFSWRASIQSWSREETRCVSVRVWHYRQITVNQTSAFWPKRKSAHLISRLSSNIRWVHKRKEVTMVSSMGYVVLSGKIQLDKQDTTLVTPDSCAVCRTLSLILMLSLCEGVKLSLT